jgi:6-phosphogluconolactonase
MRDPAGHAWVFFGTQRAGPGTGFSRARFDAATGALSPPRLVTVADDPSYFVVHPDGRHLYTCNSGTPGGVSAYTLNPATGELDFLNAHVSQGRGPSHLSLDVAGRFVLAANYDGGFVEVLALAADGSLDRQVAFVQHEGRSVHPERQTRPYAHCVRVDPENRFALVADLGLDQVRLYRFDASSGGLAPHEPAVVPVSPGSGPRHLAWHPNGRWLYLVEEISSEVGLFSWTSTTGTLQPVQSVPALPPGFAGDNTSAEILVHPTGRFVYASNRGHDSLAAFAVAESSGTLTPLQHVPSGGRTPRYMTFDLTGRWLLATNLDSDTVAIFGIDRDTGRLTLHGDPLAVRRPFGIAFVQARSLGGGLS